jgi:RNA polymerase sigma-70 factor (ECF subfamily)
LHGIERRTRGKSVSATEPPIADPAPGPADQDAARELVERVRSPLEALTPEQREGVVLRDAEGQTAPEVAAILGIDAGAVKARLHRARAALRDRLGEALTPPSAGADCDDVVALYPRNLEDELDASTCARMERHLADCVQCRHVCDAVRDVLRLCRAVGDEPVPPRVRERVRAELRRCLARP